MLYCKYCLPHFTHQILAVCGSHLTLLKNYLQLDTSTISFLRAPLSDVGQMGVLSLLISRIRFLEILRRARTPTLSVHPSATLFFSFFLKFFVNFPRGLVSLDPDS